MNTISSPSDLGYYCTIILQQYNSRYIDPDDLERMALALDGLDVRSLVTLAWLGSARWHPPDGYSTEVGLHCFIVAIDIGSFPFVYPFSRLHSTLANFLTFIHTLAVIWRRRFSHDLDPYLPLRYPGDSESTVLHYNTSCNIKNCIAHYKQIRIQAIDHPHHK
ncbi:hypothetical protein VTL71DRAFT_13567 [Oculimacula yallundae]|uniref:Uncharacterized protein n=1 Tax=Oculimacula yallundae TaxID=86028 RepID=A0ABR4CKQ2_9HELO